MSAGTNENGAIGGSTDHLTRVRDSFFGQICSRVSGLIFHWLRRLERMARWTEDFTLTWPETSEEGWNLVDGVSAWESFGDGRDGRTF